MSLISSLAATFQVTDFDVIFFLLIFGLAGVSYYFLTLHQVFEAAFGAIVGLGIYILLSVLLLGNPALGTGGGLFPFGFSVFIVSLAIYLVYILAILFPIHGGLIIAEPTHPTLYTVLHVFVSVFFLYAMFATGVYMVEQAYIFKPGTFFMWFRDMPYYVDMIKNSAVYLYIMTHQDTIIPLGILLMLYKILLSNIVNAAILSIWYNLSHVGFYKKSQDSHYRVEFHEVGGSAGHDDHGHDDHHGDSHGHGDAHNSHGHH